MTGSRERFEEVTIVYKEYVDPITGTPRVYTGRVTQYKKPFYQIIYEEDGNIEDMNHTEVAKHARRKTNTVNCSIHDTIGCAIVCFYRRSRLFVS